MTAICFVAPAFIALAFVLGAAAGVKWTTDVWFMFLDDEMGEAGANNLIDRFERWKRWQITGE